MKAKLLTSLLLITIGWNASFAQQKYLFGITFPKTYNKVKMTGPVVTKSDGWKLIFEDNFDGTKADESKWNFYPPWGTVFVFTDKNRNDSMQNGALETFTPNNVAVSNGTAKLSMKREQVVAQSLNYMSDTSILGNGLPNKRVFDFTSGCLMSKGHFGPGRFEIRCKIPSTDGVWPAFWLYGACGQEFDAFEFINEKYSTDVDKSNKSLHMTYHKNAKCDDGKTWSSHGTTLIDTIDYSKSFHTFSVEWDQYQITWRVDGEIKKVVYGLKKLHSKRTVDENKVKKGRTYRLYQVMPDEKIKMDIIVSSAVTNYGNGVKPLTRGEFPKILEVDYVKVWEKEKK